MDDEAEGQIPPLVGVTEKTMGEMFTSPAGLPKAGDKDRRSVEPCELLVDLI
jgi:hypothetical protein